jgi:hypothetical protein
MHVPNDVDRARSLTLRMELLADDSFSFSFIALISSTSLKKGKTTINKSI